jgi:hypothetical protein
VIGTGDLSEFALGWCTYGVGDQMSHYGVNASVPKTLIQHLIRWIAQTQALGADVSGVLGDVLATTISPELVPGDKDKPTQSSEATVGPYELQDFHLYYTLRFGYRPSKVAFLAWSAWHDVEAGYWPGIAAADRHAYDIATIKRWLGVFLTRFFHDSQFKRSAMPNAPKVGSGGSLSPRGDYRAPSDAHATGVAGGVERRSRKIFRLIFLVMTLAGAEVYDRIERRPRIPAERALPPVALVRGCAFDDLGEISWLIPRKPPTYPTCRRSSPGTAGPCNSRSRRIATGCAAPRRYTRTPWSSGTPSSPRGSRR